MCSRRNGAARVAAIGLAAISLGRAVLATPQEPRHARQARPGEYLVTFQGVPDQDSVTRVLDAAGASIVRHFKLLPGAYYVRSSRQLKQLQEDLGPQVRVVPNRLLFLNSTEPSPSSAQPVIEKLPDDPLFSSQWGLRNVGQTINTYYTGTSGCDLRAAHAWSSASTTPVVVAVLDTGIGFGHPDLGPNRWVNDRESGGLLGEDDDDNGYVDDVNGWNFVPTTSYLGGGAGEPNADDFNGHGTAVASILGAAGNNTTGMTGVAWACRLMSLRIFTATSDGVVADVATAIAAIEYAAGNGASVASCSWGASEVTNPADFDNLERAIRNANKVLFVASAGNGSGGSGVDIDSSPFYPASFLLENLLAVTGVDYNDALPANFNYGLTRVHLGAPGVQIVIADAASGDYRFVPAGTSFAAPHVAGAAALLWGQPGASSWPLADVRRTLLDTARAVPALTGKTVTGGVLDLQRLMESLPVSPVGPFPDPHPDIPDLDDRVILPPPRDEPIEAGHPR